METALIAPANYSFLGIPTVFFSFLIPIAGVALFTYIMAIRIAPLVLAAPDFRFNRFVERIVKVVRIWLLQYRQPRYKTAGIIHIMIFAGFLVLATSSFPPNHTLGVMVAQNMLVCFLGTVTLLAAALHLIQPKFVRPQDDPIATRDSH